MSNGRSDQINSLSFYYARKAAAGDEHNDSDEELKRSKMVRFGL